MTVASGSLEIDLAFRARAETVVVATTGVGSFGASAIGFTRDTGSFVTDRFRVGQEVFPNAFDLATTPKLIEKVEAELLTIRGGLDVEAIDAGRSLVVGLPAERRWENNDLTPEQDLNWIEGTLLTSPSRFMSGHIDGGWREERGMYVLRWYGIQDLGTPALRAGLDALLALFAPETPIVLPDSTVVRVRGDSGPWISEITNRVTGFAQAELTIPWRRFVPNVVA